MSSRTICTTTEFLARKRAATFALALRFHVDVADVRSAFAVGWHEAQLRFDPTRGASIDTFATALAEAILMREQCGAFGSDAWQARAFNQLQDEEGEEVFGDDVLEPLGILQRGAARIRAERRADACLQRLAARGGRKSQQLAEVARIIADGGDRDDVVKRFGVKERHVRKLFGEAAVAALAVGGEV